MRGLLALTCALACVIALEGCEHEEPDRTSTKPLSRVYATTGVGYLRTLPGIVYRFGGRSLEAFDSSDPAALSKSDEYPSSVMCQDVLGYAGCSGLVLSSGYAFVGDDYRTERLSLLDRGAAWSYSGADKLEPIGGGFVAGTAVFDLAPSLPVMVATLTTGALDDVRSEGNMLWGSNAYSNELVVFDVADLATPTLISRIPVATAPGWVIDNRFLHQTHGIAVGPSDHLFAISSRPDEPEIECRLLHLRADDAFSSVEIIGETDTFEWCSSVTRDQDLIFLATNYHMLSDHLEPQVIVFRLNDDLLVEVARIDLRRRDGWASEVIIDGSILFVSQTNALTAYDLNVVVPP